MIRQMLLCLVLILLPGLASAEVLNFLVYGASGKVGTHVVDEALSRGHNVTAVSRDPSRIEKSHTRLNVVQGNVLDPENVQQLLEGMDIVVISLRGATDKSGSGESSVVYQAAQTVIAAMQSQHGKPARLIHVGGSGSLMLPNGKRFADTIPRIFIPKSLELEIDGQILTLEFLRGVDDVPWTYITPPENFTNGDRTGEFRIGGDMKLEDEQSRSRISRADFAVAVVNEAETSAHLNQRISVAY